MSELKDTADFLHLFSEEDGLKFLTHDIKSSGMDLVDYVYSCERLILRMRNTMKVSPDVFELVRGFVFGPRWTDYEGRVHQTYASSERWMDIYETTGEHPLNNKALVEDFDAFRDSVRFRTGKLEKFLLSLKEDFPSLDIDIRRSIKGADFYTDTRHLRNAIREIISSMSEYSETPHVVISYTEDGTEDGYIASTMVIEQLGSYPTHTLLHDQRKLHDMGGTLANICTWLDGCCTWSVESRWSDDSAPVRWNILRLQDVPELEKVDEAVGFRHVITVYHKL